MQARSPVGQKLFFVAIYHLAMHVSDNPESQGDSMFLHTARRNVA